MGDKIYIYIYIYVGIIEIDVATKLMSFGVH